MFCLICTRFILAPCCLWHKHTNGNLLRLTLQPVEDVKFFWGKFKICRQAWHLTVRSKQIVGSKSAISPMRGCRTLDCFFQVFTSSPLKSFSFFFVYAKCYVICFPKTTSLFCWEPWGVWVGKMLYVNECNGAEAWCDDLIMYSILWLSSEISVSLPVDHRHRLIFTWPVFKF